MTYTVEQFRKDLVEPYAWPGGYQRYFLCSDGEVLSYEAAEEHQSQIEEAITHREFNGGWLVVACEINWEDNDLRCAHTGEKIPSAYGED